MDALLVALTDADFDAMLHGRPIVRERIAAPPGGVDEISVVKHVRAIANRLRTDGDDCGQWMIVAGGEAVGLCGFKDRPNGRGEVEIGYGIAASRRRRGHATRAVALLVAIAQRDSAIRAVIAQTVVDNVASHRVLERNGFTRTGTRLDPDDGELYVWRRDV